MNPYVYLFVREDLSHPQQIVQTAHAVDELNKKHPHESGNYMVLCGVKNEKELVDLSFWFDHKDILHHMFYEPDVDGYTAIATKPLIGSERNAMKKFRLKSS